MPPKADEVTENFQLNRIIIIVLGTVMVGSLAGMFAAFLITKQTDSMFKDIIVLISGGMIGFLSRGFRPSTPAGSGNVGDVLADTVNVNPPALVEAKP